MAKININCKQCGVDFLSIPSEIKAGKKYCSLKCRNEASKKIKVERIKIKCSFCCKEFDVKHNEIKNGKKYCSVNCQHNAYKKLKVKRVEQTCIKCENKFLITEYRKKIDGGKYCSRKCKDSHQKELYKKDGNPAYGKKHSETRKKGISENSKKMWQSTEFRKNFSEKVLDFYNKNGYFPGTDEASKEKRKKNNLEKYGVTCLFKKQDFRKKYEDDYFLKNGVTTTQNATKHLLKKRSTKIEEKIKEILIKNLIQFKKNFFVRSGAEKKDFKIYDFYLKEYNLLIEADGDYWHANPAIYKDKKLNEIQIKNINNDVLKNKIATKKGFIIIRFWESEINQHNFESLLIEKIKESGEKNINL